MLNEFSLEQGQTNLCVFSKLSTILLPLQSQAHVHTRQWFY